jgi:outer membrane protein assembly factor BamB
MSVVRNWDIARPGQQRDVPSIPGGWILFLATQPVPESRLHSGQTGRRKLKVVDATRVQWWLGLGLTVFLICSARADRDVSLVSQEPPVAMTVGGLTAPDGITPPNPYPPDELTDCYERAAAYILGQAQFFTGRCLVYGAGQGRLACELRIRSALDLLGVESDPNQVNTGRALLDAGDIYGDRITLHAQSLDPLPYRDYAGLLVVSDTMIATGRCPGSAAEMFRMIRPDGGIAILGQPPGCPHVLQRSTLEQWLRAADLQYTIVEDSNGLWAHLRRGPLPGAGEWTHMWADPANTACSGDRRITDHVRVLWYGEPGPRVMTDRHWRPAAPLYQHGRLVIPGDNQILCLDAYNGARLWNLPVPASSRIAILRDAGWLALDDEHVYAAVGSDCLVADVRNGQVLHTYHTPDEGKDWGYLAVEGELLLGSTQARGASRLSVDYYDQGRAGNQISRLDNQPTVVSQGLFCRDRKTGALLWTYDRARGRDGQPFVIANPTITIEGDGVYFYESYTAGAVNQPNARVPPAIFCGGASEYLVRLDKNTGALVWRRQHDLPFTNIIYLSYHNNLLLASGCTTAANFWYHYRAYHASDGSPAWEKDWDSGMASSDKEHGKQDKHPMLIGDSVYLKFGSYDLQTGSSIGFRFDTTNCADCSACATHCFGRNNGNPVSYNFAQAGAGSVLSSAMRPGCYISIIPAGGIILLPAYSAGCTCGYTLQTSIAWQPVGPSAAD